MSSPVPVTTYQWASRAIEVHIQDCKNRGLNIDEAKLKHLLPQLTDRLMDFLCVLKFKKTLAELVAMGDAGIIKLVQVAGASALAIKGPVQRRYEAAVMAGEINFINKVDDAAETEARY